MDIDLSKFDLDAAAVHPYLSIVPSEKTFDVFEGAFGKRYRYFSIPVNSDAGKMCQEYYKRYFVQNAHRFNYYEEGEALLTFAGGDAGVWVLDGRKAYFKYWNSLTKKDKQETHFNVIPHFTALKEWYKLRFKDVMKRNRSRFTSRVVREAFVEKWINHLMEEMAMYLQPTQPPVKFSILSMSHAEELLKFYNWVERRRRGKKPGASGRSIGSRFWTWAKKDSWLVKISVGVITAVLVAIILKKLHLKP